MSALQFLEESIQIKLHRCQVGWHIAPQFCLVIEEIRQHSCRRRVRFAALARAAFQRPARGMKC